MNKKNTVSYKEIYEQPSAMASLMTDKKLYLEAVNKAFTENNFEEVIFTGCGTSLYIAQIAANIFSHYNSVKAKAVPCSELYFNEGDYISSKNTLVCPITRKSYTTEVKLAIEHVRKLPQVKTFALTCCEGSKEYNDYWMIFRDSHEDSVVMTKSFTGLVYLSAILGMAAAKAFDDIDAMAAQIPQLMQLHLDEGGKIAADLIEKHSNVDFIVILGQGVNYGVANECVNKIKEMSLSKTEAFHTLEYRHGPMSLVDENTLIVLLPTGNTGELERTLLMEMKEKGAVVAVIGEDTGLDWSFCDYKLLTKTGLNDRQLSVVTGVIGQMLGLEIAQSKGLNPDTPRHLAQAIVLK